jgi:hypothetical protein
MLTSESEEQYNLKYSLALPYIMKKLQEYKWQLG